MAKGKKGDKKASKKGKKLLNPIIEEWFYSRYKVMTEPQQKAVPLISKGTNVLISSPTGTGKTLSAFLSILSRLYDLDKNKKLEDRVYCIYISPLKALANDIQKNLIGPLAQIEELARKNGIIPPEIRVSVRSGDTSHSERQKMMRKPPHILITTPESFTLILASDKFRKHLPTVNFMIVDEIHELFHSKRGTLWSLSAERLEKLTKKPMVRIGLSATQEPIKEVAKFLGGFTRTAPRPVEIISVSHIKKTDVKVLSPVRSLIKSTKVDINKGLATSIKQAMAKSETALIFTNTRRRTESLAHDLKLLGVKGIDLHHGSLSKESRKKVEDGLKSGTLKGVVTSTSLELGIDIGTADLVCQVGSPKSITKAIQRIGRTGHTYGGVSKGIFFATEVEDAIECGVIANCITRRTLDKISMPKNCTDVLAQFLVGLTLNGGMPIKEAHAIIHGAYPFRDYDLKLTRELVKFQAFEDKAAGFRPLVWYDTGHDKFGALGRSRLTYLMNVGTISEESTYKVISERGAFIGEVSERYAERLRQGDVFVLGGKVCEFIHATGTRIFIRESKSLRPNIPSWTGEQAPRSIDLSTEIGIFKEAMNKAVKEGGIDRVERKLIKEYHMDKSLARSVAIYLKKQTESTKLIPTTTRPIVELFAEASGRHNIVFHHPLGKQVNEIFSSNLSYILRERYDINTVTSSTDNGFVISFYGAGAIAPEDVAKAIEESGDAAIIDKWLDDSELFRKRLRHCAERSLTIVKKMTTPSIRKKWRTKGHTFDSLLADPKNPITKEARREVLNDVFNIEEFKRVFHSIKKGDVKIELIPWRNELSPFGILLMLEGIEDVLSIPNKTALRLAFGEILSDTAGIGNEVMQKEDLVKIRESVLMRWSEVTNEEAAMELIRETGAITLSYNEAGWPSPKPFVRRGETLFSLLRPLIKRGEILNAQFRSKDVFGTKDDLSHLALVGLKYEKSTKTQKRIIESLGDSEMQPGAIAKEMGVKVEVVTREIPRMWQAGLLYKTADQSASATYGAVPIVEVERVALLSGLAINVLMRDSPCDAATVASSLGVSKEEMLGVIDELCKSGLVKKVQPENEPIAQYCISSDSGQRGGTFKRVDKNRVMSYFRKLYFDDVKSMKSFFDRFGELGSIDELLCRFSLTYADFAKFVKDEDIIHARLYNGRARFIRRRDAQRIACVVRRGKDITALEQKVIQAVKKEGALSIQEIFKRIKQKRITIQEAIERLERQMILVRRVDINGTNISKSRLVCFEAQKGKSTVEDEIMKYLEGYGPVTPDQLARHFGIQSESAEVVMSKLIETKKLERFVISGEEDMVFYTTHEHFQAIRKNKDTDEGYTGIIPYTDPYTERIWPYLVYRFGFGKFNPFLINGDLSGACDFEAEWDCFEVFDASVLNREDMGRLAKELPGYGKRVYECDVVRVRKIGARTCPELSDEDIQPFLDSDYIRMNSFIAHGEILKESFPFPHVLNMILHKQRIYPDDRLSDTLEVAKEFHGLRSQFESGLRSNEHIELDALVGGEELYICQGIPDFSSYCTLEDILLFKTAKDAVQTKGVAEIMDLLRHGALAKTELLDRCSMGRKDFESAIKISLTGCFVYKNAAGKFILAGQQPGVTVESARRNIILEFFRQFGTISLSQLSILMKGVMSPETLIVILKKLEDDNTLRKGFIVSDDDDLYWIRVQDIKTLNNETAFPYSLVLTPDDRITLLFAKKLKERFGTASCFPIINGGDFQGAFKGSIRQGCLNIARFIGDDELSEIVQGFAQFWNLKIVKKNRQVDEDDWEIIRFVDKMRAGEK